MMQNSSLFMCLARSKFHINALMYTNQADEEASRTKSLCYYVTFLGHPGDGILKECKDKS